jgi:thymidine phosphorylase
LHRKVGDLVIENEKLCTLYINDPANAKEAEAIVREAIQLGSDPPPLSPIVKEVLR